MNRIDETFQRLQREKRKGLIGYLTAGDPGLAVSEQIVRMAVQGGIDILELGVPFSDPTADGPVIQEAAQRALAAGTCLEGIFEVVEDLRADLQTPIVLFGYANPFFIYGYERLCADAAGAGVDGLLVVDLPFEEADELRGAAERHGLYLIPLIAPTTSPERAAVILKRAQGFVYYIMVTGVTGMRDQVTADVAEQVRRLRAVTKLPIAVGFGIANGRQARAAAEHADAVVVGSALVRAAHSGGLQPLVWELREALG